MAKQKILTSEIQSQIGRRLRAKYQDLVQEPVPDKFLHLLDQLAASEQGNSGPVLSAGPNTPKKDA